MKLEHANLSTAHLEQTIQFLQTAFPDFKVRGSGTGMNGLPWCHVGNEQFYLALTSVEETDHRAPYSNSVGFNHLGWEVDDLDALIERMASNGYRCNLSADTHPARRRRYYFDPDGNDWEFVEYTTDNQQLRNDYSDAE